MNNVVLIGRLTKDPDVRYTQGEQPMEIARYTLAVNRGGKKKEGEATADFIGCVAFGKSGEFAERYLKKGTKIAVRGHIQTGSYTNKEGQKVYTTDVVVDQHEFVEGKASAAPVASAAPAPATPVAPAPAALGVDPDVFMNIPDGIDDELPFN